MYAIQVHLGSNLPEYMIYDKTLKCVMFWSEAIIGALPKGWRVFKTVKELRHESHNPEA